MNKNEYCQKATGTEASEYKKEYYINRIGWVS
jgi:hypothetical protein